MASETDLTKVDALRAYARMMHHLSATLANVQDIAISSRSNLLRGQRFDRQGVAVEGHKFDFECFPVTMHMNDHTYIAGFKTCRR